MGKKRNLKENLTDDTLDLSLCDLQVVPVKEIAAIPKATSLDLSSNQLTSLGPNFATSLVRLVKLDLCRNQLTELPENFGLLVNLKYLDLYRNNLQTLPLSFSQLKHLRWLDLKENPLVPKMMQISGPCLDAQGCQFAARNVVKFMGEISKEYENEKLKKEMHEKQLQVTGKEILEQTQKKESKKKKKKKNASKQVENNREDLKENGSAMGDVVIDEKNEIMDEEVSVDMRQDHHTVFSSIMLFLKSTLLALLFVLFSFYMICLYDQDAYKAIINFLKTKCLPHTSTILDYMAVYFVQVVRLFYASVFTILSFFPAAVKTLAYVLEDHDFQLFIKNSKENLNILCIKLADFVVYSFDGLSTYLVNLFK